MTSAPVLIGLLGYVLGAPLEAPDPARGPRSLRRPFAVLGLFGGVGLGPLPRPGGVLSMTAGLGGPGWRTEIEAQGWLPQRTDPRPEDPRTLATALWSVGLRGCGEPRWRTFSFPLCGGLDLGAIRGEGGGSLRPTPVWTMWAAFTATASLVWWPIARWGLGVRLTGFVPLRRIVFLSQPSEARLHESAPTGMHLLGGIHVRLP